MELCARYHLGYWRGKILLGCILTVGSFMKREAIGVDLVERQRQKKALSVGRLGAELERTP